MRAHSALGTVPASVELRMGGEQVVLELEAGALRSRAGHAAMQDLVLTGPMLAITALL